MNSDRSCDKLDKTGSVASLLCAVHCALMPFLMAILPSIAFSFLASEWFEWMLFASSALIGCASIHLGVRIHGQRKAFFVLAIGLTMLALGRIGHEQHWGWWGVLLLVFGGSVVFAAHMINRAFCKSCPKCHDHDLKGASDSPY